MKEQIKIPTSKVKRATRFLATGAKVGGNYVKHYTKKVLTGNSDETDLHESNAEDIYDSLSQLKGSVLKVAQMLSMDKQALPVEYLKKFSQAQYQTPPLSYPLVVRTFRQEFGRTPGEFFDSFSREAVNAASIGQVHKASKEGKTLAVKIQYPGVAQSVSSDLKMAYPIAKTLLKMNNADLQQYMQEVEEKLLEETDYKLELQRSMDLSQRCAHLDNIVFPNYYPHWSGERIITMDWLPGRHLEELLESGINQDSRNRIGQTLWDFYQFQIHQLRQLHADPHPGNFIIQENDQVAVIDFGCTKELPADFYQSYFKLLDPAHLKEDDLRQHLFTELGFLHRDDHGHMREFFDQTFKTSIELLGRPFYQEYFDFSDDQYFQQIYEMGSELSKAPQMRNSKHGRGSRHGLYLNRTYFGLYNLLHHLGAKVQTQRFLPVMV